MNICIGSHDMIVLFHWKNVVIGAGSLIVNKVEENTRCIGNLAKKLV